MDAGRELDVLVAEKVMGWTYIETDIATIWSNADYTLDIDALPLFSTDIAAAWTVAETMQEQPDDEIWRRFSFELDCTTTLYNSPAAEAAYSICLAALKSVGVDI